ncbi:hypothetical protein [Pseudodesulfovibrio indicus]|uniref:hypothetical protein n=1 Tax=Pseudodesulfovibrio indicus TaxID=1716143 RepID=UPI00292CDF06|nr:hypothetical protein [Pseudodesulfovibrio indicus]
MPEFDLSKLRSGRDGIRESFEEFCCQLFRRTEGEDGWRYRRISGAGGDGGVEAVWERIDGTVWGLQAKYFYKFGTSEKAQMKESLDQALANYDSLTRYTYTLPATLTGKKGRKAKHPTEGQHEKLNEWRDEWIAEYSGKGRTIVIDFWDEGELLTRLTAVDQNGGMRRYWFDRDFFSDQWFSEHLKFAEAQAGDRYTPALSLKTPLSTSLEAFGKTESGNDQLQKAYKALAKEIRWWDTVHTGDPKGITEQLEEGLVAEAKILQGQSQSVLSYLYKLIETPDQVDVSAFFAEIKTALATGTELEPKVKASLEGKHGENADSKGFRQFSAEYMVSFPMAPLDHLRDLIKALKIIKQLEVELIVAPAMLVRGPAGIGKTHGVIDVAKTREASGLHSCIAFGEDFSDSDPWIRIAHKLGLGDTGREQLLEILDAAGEATGYPLILFIDALNETSPDRSRWKGWFPPIVEQVRRYSFVKVCVTCRDTYLRDVFTTPIDLPQVNHNGFADRVYDAIYQFFQHYGLGLPSGPLLQEEFTNPLFLHLVCEALRDAGKSALPSGTSGFLDVVKLLMKEKNKRVAQECDYDPRQNLVQKAILAIAELMATSNTRLLPLDDVDEATEKIIPRTTYSQSLVNILEKESLLSVVETQGEGLGGDPEYHVRFTFERIGDHFIAESLLSKFDEDEIVEAMHPGGALHFLVEDEQAAQEYAGLLEAASLLLVEKFDRELPSFSSDNNEQLFYLPFVHALHWRTPESISQLTRTYFERALLLQGVWEDAFDALLRTSIRKNHPLNADYMHGWWNRILRSVRDPILGYHLENNYSGWSDSIDQSGAVATLIDWGLHAPLEGIDTEVAILWGTSFAWFLSSPDRRIRDKATKGLVRIAIAEPRMLPPFLTRFLDSDDEYITERVLEATYGAVMLNPRADYIEEVASIIADWFAPPSGEGPPTTNAIARDHARSVLEVADNFNVAPGYLTPEMYQPPYPSEWPIHFPSDEEVSDYASDNDKFPSMDLSESSGLGTDFARYIISPRLIREFDCKAEGIEAKDVYRWFLSQAVYNGYPGLENRCAEFDKMTLSYFGGGRGKPGWAERLGKKYYWTYLHKLVGRFADHLPRLEWGNNRIPPNDELQGVDLRKIDPTDLRVYCEAPQDVSSWVVKNPCKFPFPDNPDGDAAWVASSKDFYEIKESLIVQAPDQTDWILLYLSKSWDGPRRGDDGGGDYRHISRHVGTAFSHAVDTALIKRGFKQEDWPIEQPIVFPEDYRGYLAEYPDGLGYAKRPGIDLRYAEEYDGFTLHHSGVWHLRGGEWGYDYSSEEDVPSLLMPSPSLIEYGSLKWDGCGSWQNEDGVTQVQAVNWYGNSVNALIAKLDFVDQYLDDERMALVVTGYQQKFVAGSDGDHVGINEEFSAYLRSSKRIWTLGVRAEGS